MNMTPNATKTFQPAHVTEEVRKQYESMAMTNDEASRVVIANTTTRFVLNDDLDLSPKRTGD